jgi:RecA/RadA recombinase
MTNNTKRNAKLIETPSIVLKSIHNDIMRDNANATITTKQMRAKLRVTHAHIHVRNSSWIFTQSQYDEIRAMFDANYRAKIERANKRNAQSRKRVTKSRDVVAQSNDVATNETNDANA